MLNLQVPKLYVDSGGGATRYLKSVIREVQERFSCRGIRGVP
jgi:hypothetical protein